MRCAGVNVSKLPGLRNVSRETLSWDARRV